MAVNSESQFEKMMKRATDATAESQAFAHVLIENGILPGISSTCRCEDCKLTAVKMDEAGYMDRVSDRWWDNE